MLMAFGTKGFGQSTLSLFDKLYEAEEVRITLTYPFDSLYKSNREEISSVISISSKAGVLLKDEPMSLNLRGKFRRMKCTMPPLLLNFKKSTLRSLGLSEEDEMKLVTHCLETEEGQNNLEEELLCYQVYESLTPYAYRTIWVTVTYVDTLHGSKPIISSGFLLEPDKVICNRLGLTERKLFNLAQDSLHFESYSRTAAFNFLIGNRDWSVVMSRNAKLFFDAGLSKYIVIPYDFDYSNVVAPSYRRETRPAGMVNSYDRIYQGEYFQDRAGEILKSFAQSSTNILNQVNSAPNTIQEAKRKAIYKYFEFWFDYIAKASPRELQYNLIIPYKGSF